MSLSQWQPYQLISPRKWVRCTLEFVVLEDFFCHNAFSTPSSNPQSNYHSLEILTLNLKLGLWRQKDVFEPVLRILLQVRTMSLFWCGPLSPGLFLLTRPFASCPMPSKELSNRSRTAFIFRTSPMWNIFQVKPLLAVERFPPWRQWRLLQPWSASGRLRPQELILTSFCSL